VFKSLLLSSLALNLGLLLGRLSGFVREAFVAATYGATGEADIVVLMLSVPDLLVNILVGGALGAVLIPEFSQQPNRSRQLLYQSLLFFGALFVGVAIVLFLQMEWLVTLLAPGFTAIKVEQSAVAIGWVIWLIPLTVLAGGTTAYLQSKNQFAIAALGTLIINGCIILGLFLVYSGYGSLHLVAFFVLVGGALRLLSQLQQTGLVWNPMAGLFPWLLNKVLLIRYIQVMLSSSVLLFFPVVARALASFHGEGGVALFNYATRLIEFPLVIAVTFLATIFFPRLSRSFSTDLKQHRDLIRYGVQVTLALAAVAAISLISLSADYTRLVYSHGSMQESSLIQVERLIVIGLMALPLQGLATFLTATFNARKNTRTPLLINGIGLAFFILSSYHCLFGQGLEAMMWGIVISYGLISIMQLIFLKIEMLNWWSILFDKTFLPGLICGGVLLTYASLWIGDMHFSAWISLLLVGLFSLFSLFVMALFNEELRVEMIAKLRIK
jgi:murein biosynthesis integral membrane protein MurJ